MKNLKTVLFSCLTIAFLAACGGGNTESDATGTDATQEKAKELSVDPKGVGEIKHVDLTDPLNTDMVAEGKGIYEMKCSACHKLSDQRVVGPGWAGVTNRRSPQWIMNMIMNVDVMLEEDAEARKLLEECLTRMPNQGVTKESARGIVEFMRENDMATVGTKDGAAL